MGADKRMYPEPWSTLPDFVAHDWPRHQGEMTLADTARSVVERYEIRDGDSLVGSSLGGMVACEIASIRKIHTLYLIGSATDKQEINRLLAVLHPLANLAPLDWLRFSAGKIPLELARMFAGMEASFIRAMCAAVFQWEGLTASPERIFRIHGKLDLVIPPPARADLLLTGGHLISMSHAGECVEFVRDSL